MRDDQRGVVGSARLAALLATALVAGLCAAVAAPPGASLPRPGPAATHGTAVTAAHLRLTVDTTADVTELRLGPGRVVASRVRAPSPRVRVTHDDGRWWLRTDAGADTVRAVVDLVLHDPGGAERFAVGLRSARSGTAEMTVANRNATPRTVVTLRSDRGTAPGGDVARAFPRRHALLGSTPLSPPTATDRRLVLAFYYGWFRDYDRPAMTDRPAEPRSTRRAAGVRSMTRQAAAHGIDGFVVSWAGTRGDQVAMDRAVAAAEAEDQHVTGYLETRIITQRDGGWLRELFGDRARVDRVRRRLGRLLDRADSPAFLHEDGVPVVFVYGMSELAPDQWRQILDQLDRRGKPVRLVGDAGPDYRSVVWGRHRYSPVGDMDDRAARNRSMALSARAPAVVEPGTDPGLFAATVAPGFDDHKVRDGSPLVERDDGRRYARDWRAATSASPDWVLITSWNEWFEATSVEPSARFGDRALDQTARLSTRWRDG